MIEINMNTKRLKLTIKGHAMPEEGPEYETACAAASAIAQGLAFTVAKYNNGKGAMKAFDYKNDPGNLFLKIFPEPWAERELMHRFEIYGDGLELLAESHPQYIQMIRDGERIIPGKGGIENE